MTTAPGDNKDIMEPFREQCEAYIVKPIDKNKLLNEIRLLSEGGFLFVGHAESLTGVLHTGFKKVENSVCVKQ